MKPSSAVAARSTHGTRVPEAGDDRRYALLPLVLAGAFLLVGLLTLDSYGVSWDEPLHREWGRMIWEYLAGRAELPDRLPGEGQYYGPLFYMLSYGVSELANDALGLPFTAANHLLTLIAACVGVLFTYRLARELMGHRTALGGAVLLSTLPPFVAHAHYNPKDVPLTALVTATLLFATRAYRRLRVRDAILAGAFLGWAVTMKPTALVLVPVVLGAAVSEMLVRRTRTLAEVLELTAAAAFAAVIAVFITWPTLWRDPTLLADAALYFARGSFWEGSVLYLGEFTRATNLPWHYTPVMLLIALPVVLIVLALAGIAVVVRRIVRRELVFGGVLLLLWVLLPLALFMKPGLARYDGMRQLFFVVPAIAILGGAGWNALFSAAHRRTGRRWPGVLASLAILAALAVENVRVFPYGGSYVNSATRVLHGPGLERSFEVEYWGVAYREGLRWLSRNAAPGSVVCVPLAEHVLEWQRDARRGDLTFDCTAGSHYVMAITRFSEWPYDHRRHDALRPVFTVSRYRSDLLRIYDLR